MRASTKVSVVLLVFVFLLGCATATKADTFSFTITGGYTASGTLTTGPLSGGTYQITGISGVQNGQTITGLIGPSGFAGNDNLLYAGSPLLDIPGFSFVAGGIDYNVYYDGGPWGGSATSYYETTISGVLGKQVYFSAVEPPPGVPTPEPSTSLFLGLGLFVVVLAARRKLCVASN